MAGSAKSRLMLVVLLGIVSSRAAIAQTQIAPSAATDSTHALLRPGDIVRLRIWREPDLSGDFPVDEAGTVTFPKLGPFQVSDYSAASLKAKLLESYAQYLRNPSVEVTMLRRINVLGAVKSPGLYPIDPTMTIADALALAGGATPAGDQHHVVLVRNGTRVTESLSAETNIAETPLRSGDQLFVPERSFIVRNSGLVAAGLSVTASLIIALFLRR
jgi:protein involved in polysaccharide export with SLBB domain